jgi:hypothetical protein
MSMVSISKKELKTAIKESVREVLAQEFMSLRALLLPPASRSEQKDIERRYKRPTRKSVKSLNIEL